MLPGIQSHQLLPDFMTKPNFRDRYYKCCFSLGWDLIDIFDLKIIHCKSLTKTDEPVSPLSLVLNEQLAWQGQGELMSNLNISFLNQSPYHQIDPNNAGKNK